MPNTTTTARLRELLGAATKGELQAVGFRLSHTANKQIHFDTKDIDEIGQIGNGPYQAIPFARREDAEWHAAIHNAAPALLDELDALRGKAATVRGRQRLRRRCWHCAAGWR